MADLRQYAGGEPVMAVKPTEQHYAQAATDRPHDDHLTHVRLAQEAAVREAQDRVIDSARVHAGLYRVESSAHMPLSDVRPDTARLESYPEYMQRRAQEDAAKAREARIGARDMAAAYAARKTPTIADLERTLNENPDAYRVETQPNGEIRAVAQMPGAQGKMFSRSDILAILRAEKARATAPMALTERLAIQQTCDSLIYTFENLE